MKAATIYSCINMKDVLNHIDLPPVSLAENIRGHEQTSVLIRTISPDPPQACANNRQSPGKPNQKRKKAIKFLKLRKQQLELRRPT